MKRLLTTLLVLLATASLWAQHWTAKTTKDLPNETPVYVRVMVNGQLGQGFFNGDSIRLGAFIGEECRAYANEPRRIYDLHQNVDEIFSLRVVGDLSSENNKPITFKTYVDGIEYKFTKTVNFTGETTGSISSPIVLNLDAVQNVTMTESIEVKQAASAFPYTFDVTPYLVYEYYNALNGPLYTPKGESQIVSPVEVNGVGAQGYCMPTWNGSKLTIPTVPESDFGNSIYINASVSVGEKKFYAEGRVDVIVSAIPVTSISCDITSLNNYLAYDNLYDQISSHVKILPADASNKGFHLTCSPNTKQQFDGYTLSGTGKYTISIVPDDESYKGAPATVAVTSYMRPSGIAVKDEVLELGYMDNVYDALLANTDLTWPEGYVVDAYALKDLKYTFNDASFMDANHRAVKFVKKIVAQVSLTNGVLPSATHFVPSSCEVAINVVSKFAVSYTPGATEFVNNGSVSADALGTFVVQNPNNEPFNASDLAVQMSEFRTGFPYATVTIGNEAQGSYPVRIKPEFAGSEISYSVTYKGDRVSMTPGTVVPTINISNEQTLVNGWNWVAINTMSNPKEMFVDDLFNSEDIIEIRSQYALLYNDPVYGFFGDIYGITPDEATYKVKTNKQVTINTGSYDALAYSGSSKSIYKGYNWVNNPYQFPIGTAQLAEAFGSMGLEDGDMIITKTGFASCMGNNVFEATNGFEIKPGEGLVIYAANEKKGELTYNTTLAPAASQQNHRVRAYNVNNVFSYDAHAYADNMAMIATLEGVENPERYQIGVYVGDECRGMGSAVSSGLHFICAAGKVGEKISFKLYDTETGMISDLDDVQTYKLTAGSVSQPVVLHAPAIATGIKNVRNAADSADAIYDLSGRRVQNAQKGIYIVNGKKVLK